MEYYGTTSTEKDLGAKLLKIHVSSNHTTDPPKAEDDIYICTSSSVSTSSTVELPTGCPVGKVIRIKCTGANGYVQSTEGIVALSGTSKSTSYVQISKYLRAFVYTGTTYGWMIAY